MEKKFIFEWGWKLATNAKFQHNVSKNMPASQKEHRNIGWEC